MANLKFYKGSEAYINALATTPAEGSIWFNTTNRTIQVRTVAGWEVYTGLVDATFADNKLTITKATGVPVTIDFSDVASAAALAELTTTVSNLTKTANKNTEDITALTKTVGDNKTAAETAIGENTAAIEAEVTRATRAEEALAGRVGTLETSSNDYKTRIETLETEVNTNIPADLKEITDAADALEDRVAANEGLLADLGEGVTVKSYVDTEVGKANQAVADEAQTARAAELAINEKIGGSYSKDATVAMDIQAAKDAAAAAQADIDAFLEGEAIEGSTIDTLKEIQDWIRNDETGSSALVGRVATAEGEIDALQSLVGVGEGAKTVDERIAAAKTELVDGASEGYATLGDLEAKVKDLEAAVGTEGSVADAIEDAVAPVRTQANTNKQNIEALQGKVDVEKVSTAVATAKQEAISAVVGDAETYQTLGALEDALNTLDGAAVKSVTGTSPYITVTGDKEAVVAAVTGSVASNDNKLAVASDVKTYVDAQVTNGLSWAEFE